MNIDSQEKYVGKCFRVKEIFSYSDGGIHGNEIIMIVGFGSKIIFDEELEGVYFLSKNRVCFYYFLGGWTFNEFLKNVKELL